MIKTLVFQCLQHAAHAAIDRSNHGTVNAATVVFDLGQGVVVFFAGLQWRVHAPVGQVHEKGAVLIFANGIHGFIGEIVCEIAFGFKPMATVVAHTKAHVGPQKTNDGVKVLFGVDSAWVFFWQVQTTFHEQTFVKALVVGPHFWRTAQVPFANVNVVVSTFFEYLCSCQF